jgi:DNA replication protein DnaC
MERLNRIMYRAVKRSGWSASRSLKSGERAYRHYRCDDRKRLGLVEGELLDPNNTPEANVVADNLYASDQDGNETSLVLPKTTEQHLKPLQGVCELCHGAGYVRRMVPYGHTDFGKAFACSCRETRRKEQEQKQLKALSQLDTFARFRQATFETYDMTLPGVLDAYEAACYYAFVPKGWLVLAGPNGCGKTHLAVAMARERLEAGDSVLLQAVPDLLDRLRSGFSASAEQSYEVMFQQMRSVDFLILDDLGAQQNSVWAAEKLFQLLNYRYNGMLPTMITTNLMSLEGIEPRVVSRLRDCGMVRMIVMEGAMDYRPNLRPMMEDE